MIDFNSVENTESGQDADARGHGDGNLLPPPTDEDEEDTVRLKVEARIGPQRSRLERRPFLGFSL